MPDVSARRSSKGGGTTLPDIASPLKRTNSKPNATALLTPTTNDAPANPLGSTAELGATGVVKGKSEAVLTSELSEAKKELDTREEHLRSVQRNYEALAKLCHKNIQVVSELKAELEDAENRISKYEGALIYPNPYSVIIHHHPITQAWRSGSERADWKSIS
jgi:predicted lipid-binding transport protein (Tim44 family)